MSFCVLLMWYRFLCDIRVTDPNQSLSRKEPSMPFKTGEDYRDVRVRYQEDELVIERAKCAANIIKEHIKSRNISQAQYCYAFGFKSRNPIHKRFLSGKVTLIDLIRIISAPGFNISIDDALRRAIKEIEYIDRSVAPVEEPKAEPAKEAEEEPSAKKSLKRPALLDEELDTSVFEGTSFERFEKLFSGVRTDEETC